MNIYQNKNKAKALVSRKLSYTWLFKIIKIKTRKTYELLGNSNECWIWISMKQNLLSEKKYILIKIEKNDT